MRKSIVLSIKKKKKVISKLNNEYRFRFQAALRIASRSHGGLEAAAHRADAEVSSILPCTFYGFVSTSSANSNR